MQTRAAVLHRAGEPLTVETLELVRGVLQLG